MRLLYDSTTASDIPAGSQLVAGYLDGSSAWSAADWERFPGRTIVRIAIFNNRLDAHVLDIEPGNNDALSAMSWVRAKWLRGDVPTIYCFSDAGPVGYRISDVRKACDDAGVKRPLILIAEWDNDTLTFDPTGDPEIIGKQYANSAQTGGHYDASVVADVWPGVDGGDMDAATYAREIEDLVKGTIRVMVKQDPETIAAIEAAASDDTTVRTVATKIAVLLEGAAATK